MFDSGTSLICFCRLQKCMTAEEISIATDKNPRLLCLSGGPERGEKCAECGITARRLEIRTPSADDQSLFSARNYSIVSCKFVDTIPIVILAERASARESQTKTSPDSANGFWDTILVCKLKEKLAAAGGDSQPSVTERIYPQSRWLFILR